MQVVDTPLGGQLFTRHLHGNLPIQVVSGEQDNEVFALHGEHLHPQELLAKLYGRKPSISWRQYFRIRPPEPTLIQLITSLPIKKTKKDFGYTGRMTVGIDLRHRYEEVRKIIYKGFRGRILASGFDPEDVLQEVYLGLMVRNGGKCPWDARKSSFGHYIHMVTSCLLANYHRKEVRRPERNAEALGPDQELGTYDLEQGETGQKLAVESLEKFLGNSPGRKVLGPLLEGRSKKEIASALDLPEASIAKAISSLRGSAAAWKNSG